MKLIVSIVMFSLFVALQSKYVVLLTKKKSKAYTFFTIEKLVSYDVWVHLFVDFLMSILNNFVFN
jgi:hypothetical protein